MDVFVWAAGAASEHAIVNLTIRPANAEDADAITALLISIPHYSTFQTLGHSALYAKVADNLLRAQAQQLTLIAETDDGVMGYAVVYWIGLLFAGPEAYVSELFVHTAASGGGVGTALLNHVKREARARGCRRLSLINGRDKASYQRQFYAKQGWVEDSDSVRFTYDLRAPDGH